MSRLARCHNVADLREAARRRLPRFVFEFMDRGTEDEIALRENRAGFDRLRLRPEVLVDVSRRSLAIELLGKPSSLPLAMSPTGAAGLCWHEGEVALAKAAAQASVPFALSTTAITSMERVARGAGGRLWFQLYMWRDRALSYELVGRARDAGYEALILTVDTPVGPNREYNLRNGFSVPFNPSLRSTWDLARHPDWLINTLGKYVRTTGMPRHENYPAQFQRSITSDPATKLAMKNDSMSWADIPRLRDIWPGTLMIKGILRAEDAVRAVEQGVDAIIVSNHGGRNMDSAVAPIDALPEVAAAVAGRCTILLDSGVRRGSDIVKAVALGADAVLVGRPVLYGIAAAGEAGALHAIELLRNELDKTMAFMGCNTMADLRPDHVTHDRRPAARNEALRRVMRAAE